MQSSWFVTLLSGYASKIRGMESKFPLFSIRLICQTGGYFYFTALRNLISII